jgi:hypothetical protein
MREVDDVHHAEDDDQAESGKQKKSTVRTELVQDAQRDGHTVHANLTPQVLDGSGRALLTPGP